MYLLPVCPLGFKNNSHREWFQDIRISQANLQRAMPQLQFLLLDYNQFILYYNLSVKKEIV